MIANDRQYQVTKSQLEKLEGALAGKTTMTDGLDPRLGAAMRDGIRSQVEELRKQIAEYERRVSRPKPS